MASVRGSSSADNDLHQVTQKSNPTTVSTPNIPPMLSELKTKLAKLEEELYPKVAQHLELLLSKLENDSDLDKMIMLCKFRSMIVDTTKLKIKHGKRNTKFHMAIDALKYLIDCESHSAGFYFPPDTKNLSEFIYEIYAIYELCCRLNGNDDGPYHCCSLLYVMDAITLYIVRLCRGLGHEKIWIHFELVDKEIRDLKLNPEQVELLDFMAIGGYTRVAGYIPKNIELISDQNPAETIQVDQQQPEPKIIIPESRKNVPIITGLNSFEIHQSESNQTIQTIHGTDSNVANLDLDEHHDAYPILKPTKITSPKPSEETDSQPENGEDGFEVLKVSESEKPDVVDIDLVNTTKNLEIQKLDKSPNEPTTITTSSSIKDLSKEGKQKNIYGELQNIQQNLDKSQQLLSELLHKLLNQNIN